MELLILLTNALGTLMLVRMTAPLGLAVGSLVVKAEWGEASRTYTLRLPVMVVSAAAVALLVLAVGPPKPLASGILAVTAQLALLHVLRLHDEREHRRPNGAPT